jgi:hypothetical protein
LKLLPIERFVEKNYTTIKYVILNLHLTVLTTLEALAAFVGGFTVQRRILLVNKLHEENFIMI